MTTLTIGKVAKATGLSVETIRYYEREGLLPEPRRSASGYRIYPEGSISQLRFIRRAKWLGFTLTEISDLLRLSSNAGNSADVKALTERKLKVIEQRMAELSLMRSALSGLADSCPGSGDIDQCPIINALNGDNEWLDD